MHLVCLKGRQSLTGGKVWGSIPHLVNQFQWYYYFGIASLQQLDEVISTEDNGGETEKEELVVVGGVRGADEGIMVISRRRERRLSVIAARFSVVAGTRIKTRPINFKVLHHNASVCGVYHATSAVPLQGSLAVPLSSLCVGLSFVTGRKTQR